ncbi:hypothetical protein NDU88_005894 [Pleurodeles waltl]|uniref:Uncharacterized protein n=1 Tax=Pleurodeles waltl TaxID=8319 RepID=A0AAV7RNF7_PLEWA|nr:hypothetical protein NDU88_005894 [Pleurodeles waltl]
MESLEESVLPWAAWTGRAPRPDSCVGHGTEGQLPTRNHWRCTCVPLSSATTWELRWSSGEQCAAPGCDFGGAGGETQMIPGGPPGLRKPLQTPQAERVHLRLARLGWEMHCAALCTAKEALAERPR